MEFKTARANAQNLSYRLKVSKFAAWTTSESVSRMESGHPGKLPVDVVSKSFSAGSQCCAEHSACLQPNNVWSGLKHLRAHEHGERSDSRSEL